MNVFFEESLDEIIGGKSVYLDNDFLSRWLEPEVFTILAERLSTSYLTIDPLTRFEFLRDVFLPTERKLKEEFISQEIFFADLNHQEIFAKLQNNALLLSKIYSHKRQNRGNSLVDYFLAARLIYRNGRALLITGNIKDFPDCVFNVVSTINITSNDGRLICYGIIEFDREKFDNCCNDLGRLDQQVEEELSSLN